ncbi:hypothetical protein H0H87_011960 [Tephrocybe sp. NHM501043]|nr:hypothetical protein H0H87_011960 [Tephrocybe sp. NHM501043]
MADVRALLKAKRQEARITHPFAAYTSAGQLRCSACSAPVKHASAWEGHIGSKVHRTNVARMREEERRQQEQAERDAEAHAAAEAAKQRSEETTNGKRKAAEEEDSDDDRDMEVDSNDTNSGAKRRRVGSAPGRFPADFFSDPSHAPIPSQPDSDDEDASGEGPIQTDGLEPLKGPPSAIDLEYERFQREMLGPAATQTDKRDTYERATVMAEPELAETDETPGGFPTQDQQMDVDAEKEKQSEEELARRQKEQDERELIMDRLMDEERAQEEADQRVSTMKARLEALKQKRGARKPKESAS